MRTIRCSILLAALLGAACGAFAEHHETYDLLIRGARVIDPESGLNAPRDSFSEGTHIEASDLPTGEEKAFLESLGDVVPEEIFIIPRPQWL